MEQYHSETSGSELFNISDFKSCIPSDWDGGLSNGALPRNFRSSTVEIIGLSPDVMCVCLRLTRYKQNTRLIYSLSTKEAVIVDPAGEHDKVLQAIRSRGLSLKGIWLTHSHQDHCGGAWALKKDFKAPLLGSAHPFENTMRMGVRDLNRIFGIKDSSMRDCPAVDIALSEGDSLTVGKLSFVAIETPGHSPGHISFYCESQKVLLSGDLIFEKSIATTKIPGASPRTLHSTIMRLKHELPEDTLSLAGHGRSIHIRDWKTALLNGGDKNSSVV